MTLPLSDRQVIEVLLAALAVAIGLSCEVYERVAGHQERGDDVEQVHRVSADLVVVEEPEEPEQK
jgi:hypothetical protein